MATAESHGHHRGAPFHVVSVLLLALGLVLLGLHLSSRPDPAPVPAHPFSLRPEQVAGRGSTLVLDPGVDRLVVPSLDIDARLDEARVSAGLLDLPSDVSHVALWEGSASVGSRHGALLVAGHVDNADQDDGALHDLAEVEAGAAVHLVHGGTVTRWVVSALETVAKRSLPRQVWAGAGGPRRLYLVTCAGSVVDGHYADNLVLTAVPAENTAPTAKDTWPIRQ